jgi:hypothetical protein
MLLRISLASYTELKFVFNNDLGGILKPQPLILCASLVMPTSNNAIRRNLFFILTIWYKYTALKGVVLLGSA